MRFPISERPSATVPGSARARDLGAILLLAVALGFSTFLASGCGTRRAQRQARVAVTVARVERHAMPVQIVTSGTIEPVQTANVGSQVGGVVQRIAIAEGQAVSAGQLLIELDPRPFRAALEQALGQLSKDQAQWVAARLNAERSEKLLAQNLVAPADHDQAQASAESYRAAVRADSASVTNARLNLDFAGIRAPIAGRTGRLNVHVGDLVKAGTSDPLVTINEVSPIRVSFTVPQDQIPLIQRYREARPRVFVRPSGGDSLEIEGRLAFVDNAVDPATGTLLLKGEIANRDGALWPGEFVQLRLVLTMEPDAIVVPAPAVTIGQQGAYVYVLNPDSTATARPVTVKRTDDVTAVVASGLKPGETVVTDGQFRLAPGAKVLVRKAGQGTRP
jgi:multidrug efflux system membrane fusion protein